MPSDYYNNTLHRTIGDALDLPESLIQHRKQRQ